MKKYDTKKKIVLSYTQNACNEASCTDFWKGKFHLFCFVKKNDKFQLKYNLGNNLN